MSKVDFRRYDNSWYDPGRSVMWRAMWMFLGQPLFRATWFASSALRTALLRFFGARIGQRVVIRQHVIVKYPWHLVVGDDCWIGEQVWIDNLTTVRLGSNVCLSQGAYLCTGNHDWSDPAFGLKIAPIAMDDGAWAGAKSILMPGTHLGEGAVAGAGGVVSGTVPPFHIVTGNPAKFLRIRSIGEHPVHSANTPEAARQEVTR